MPTNAPHTPILLASSSIYRRKLLAQLGLPFSHCSPDIDESAHPGEPAEQLVARLATAKAAAAAADHPQHLIIGSDQVAALDGAILCKPGSADKARAQLQLCSARQVTFYTGLCLYNSSNGRQHCVVEPFSVVFRELSSQQIDRYLAAEKPFDCAGSFKVEGLGITLFERLIGDDPNSLIGLPLIRLTELLAKHGIELP